MNELQEIKEALERIEAHLCEEEEVRQLGHRIEFDIRSGFSTNVNGLYCEPDRLDENGLRIRL